jgi:Gluconate 2-dehydrogenase subunit 3
MDRRQALQNIGILMGLSPFTVLAVETFQVRSSKHFSNQFFSVNDKELIAEIAEMIIPTTKTVGAKDAGVPAFIEMMIQECYRKPEQEMFSKGLENLETKAKALSGSFVSLKKADKTKLLDELEAEAMKNPRAPSFWILIKELTLIGYYTSEVGMTQSMEYVPVPTKVENIKIGKDQKAYSEYVSRF